MKLRMLMLCGLVAASASVAATEDYGRQFQRDCSSCHGRKADKAAFNKAPPLITLTEQQAVDGMTKIRDAGGNSAAARAKAKLTDEQIKGLAAFIQTQK
ncbi:c-type cytochrome [Atlantibacter hermannii]|uniref:c-type cytochrome n=1 Tax=Atlantibacter hermannii TaxID=565 RepID=UPI0022B7C034|nr:c-type cytochrome [Atlantibacter hermannii]MCZ7837103.1 c-type cytochrome [Atlantibacter hermannii]